MFLVGFCLYMQGSLRKFISQDVVIYDDDDDDHDDDDDEDDGNDDYDDGDDTKAVKMNTCDYL
jgi:hypothetical protein